MSPRPVVAGAVVCLVLGACGGGSTDDAAKPTAVPVETTSPLNATDADSDPPRTDTDTHTDTATPGAEGASDEAAVSEQPPAVEAPEILQFANALVGGGELDAATTAGTPTAFWFWAPT